MTYDSTTDTKLHILQVRDRLTQIIDDLNHRSWVHDASKLEEPEKSMFDEYTPKLRDMTYDSPEYKAVLEEMQATALKHHYEANDHHPEHHEDGILGMNLLQIIEMLADWKAATMRHADGNLRRSIEQNAKRFGYGPELYRLLMNTVEYLGWQDD